MLVSLRLCCSVRQNYNMYWFIFCSVKQITLQYGMYYLIIYMQFPICNFIVISGRDFTEFDPVDDKGCSASRTPKREYDGSAKEV